MYRTRKRKTNRRKTDFPIEKKRRREIGGSPLFPYYVYYKYYKLSFISDSKEKEKAPCIKVYPCLLSATTSRKQSRVERKEKEFTTNSYFFITIHFFFVK